MRKKLLLIPVLVIAGGLTSCKKIELPADNFSSYRNTSMSSEYSVSSSTSFTASTDPTFFESSRVPTPSVFLPDNFTAPDGSTVNLSEAVGMETNPNNTYTFDFGFIRFAETPLYTTFDDPTLYDWETGKFSRPFAAENTKYIKVKAGDELENGLVVKEAMFWYDYNLNSNNEIYQATVLNSISFESKEMTLIGYLYSSPDAEDGYFIFYADPSRSDPIPISYSGGGHEDIMEIIVEDNKFAAMGDKAVIGLKETDNTNAVFSKLIVPGEYREAKIKINEISVYYAISLGRYINATLVDLEIL